ncbi:MAG TPA: hypothetical protein VF669_21575 [Tepidisphaeraceae bacterium]|jgi:hypothetical protein
MPVGFGGLLLALAIWIGGTLHAHRRIRVRMLARHDTEAEGPLPPVRPLFWTLIVSIALALVCFLLSGLIEWISLHR